MRKTGSIHDLLDFLRRHIEILNRKNPYTNPVISLKSSDLRKNSSEFHRIGLKEKYRSVREPEIFWVKIVKNKPIEKINESIDRQFKIMKELWALFHDRKTAGTHLCCEPIAVIPEFGALITRECRGRLFNTYLLIHTAIFSGNKILNYCFKLGEWLRMFHDYYRAPDCPLPILKDYCERFKAQFQTEPHPKLCYLTSCHYDLTPRNVFVSDFVQVIDYVGVNRGFPQEDMAFFSNYMLKARFNFSYSISFKKKMIRSFIEGYGLFDEPLFQMLTELRPRYSHLDIK